MLLIETSPQMLPIITIATFVSTLLGGLFALRFKDRLHLILGFSAGAVVGVAFFDLLPEALELGKSFGIPTITFIVAIGFIFYMLLDRLIIFHSHHEQSDQSQAKQSLRRGILGAGSLSLHSFLDGIAIGLGFQVSSAVGIVVAVAVLTHDFSDGINTVNMIIKNGGSPKSAFKWLAIDAIAPVVGIISTLFFTLPETTLGIVLAIFSGFFLYIGASDLLPESQHAHPTLWTTGMTMLGIATIFAVIKLANL